MTNTKMCRVADQQEARRAVRWRLVIVVALFGRYVGGWCCGGG